MTVMCYTFFNFQTKRNCKKLFLKPHQSEGEVGTDDDGVAVWSFLWQRLCSEEAEFPWRVLKDRSRFSQMQKAAAIEASLIKESQASSGGHLAVRTKPKPHHCGDAGQVEASLCGFTNTCD